MSLFGSLFGAKEHTSSIGSVLDLVTYAASLASNQDEIDPVLDKVRAISSRLGPGQMPAPTDEEVLLDVYMRIEDYLTTREPIRTFTKNELRVRLSPELLQRLTAYEAKFKGES